LNVKDAKIEKNAEFGKKKGGEKGNFSLTTEVVSLLVLN